MKTVVYAGGYTEGTDSKGIYVFMLDTDKGLLKLLSTHGECINPTFMAVDRRKTFLYAVNELKDSAKVTSYRILPGGALEYVNARKAPGCGTCHICVSDDRSLLAAANYDSGSIYTCSINDDGSIGDVVSAIQQIGSGVSERQASAHAHQVLFTAGAKRLLAVDLGMDKIIQYAVLPEGKLTPDMLQPEIAVNPGGGPRHMAWHKNGRYAYLVTELDNHIIVYEYDKQRSVFKPLQREPLLPEDFSGSSISAEVVLAHEDRHLYVSNRGFDKLSCFEVKENGMLRNRRFCECYGRGTRMMAVDPAENHMLFANEYSSRLVVAKLDKTSGQVLEKTDEYPIPKPNYVTAIDL